MANAKPYLTSNDLIDVVKRNMSVPFSQNTYNAEDFLSFANQEMFGVQVPTIMEVHEDFFTFTQDFPIVANKSRYDIPDRAIGMKLSNVYWGTSGTNPESVSAMTMINNTDKSLYAGTSNSTSCGYYYIEANQVCLTPNIGPSVSGQFLRFTYYLRPNNLVVNERAAICQNFTRDITVDNTVMLPGDSFTIGDLSLVANTDFAIGATSLATATNLNVALNMSDYYTATVSNNVVIVRYSSSQIVIKTSNKLAFGIEDRQGIEFDQVPEHITNNSVIDFLRVRGGHRTYKIDIKLGKAAVSATIIKFPMGVVPEEFEAGDYICIQYECIIPQIPSDLHNILAERTCARVLESQGDTVGLQVANAKISQLEARQTTMIDSRVDGSPRKVVNRNSLLRNGKDFRIF